jgi:phenylpyruvate tautomerase PptA (4-oxalocrotonate tautomerase family)
MPTLAVTAVEGHTDAQIQAFLKGVTALAVKELGAAGEGSSLTRHGVPQARSGVSTSEGGVFVHFQLIPATRHMRGGKTITERREGV